MELVTSKNSTQQNLEKKRNQIETVGTLQD